LQPLGDKEMTMLSKDSDGNYLHRTKDGEFIPLTKLKDSHLENILKYIERQAKQGITIFWYNDGWDVDEMWHYEEDIEGDEVLERFDYDIYQEEYLRRKALKKNVIKEYYV
jgi:hypothetical protein